MAANQYVLSLQKYGLGTVPKENGMEKYEDWMITEDDPYADEREKESFRSAVYHIRQSLQARLEGRNEGGDTEVMRLVDEIVKKEGAVKDNGHSVDCWCSECDDLSH